MADNALLASLRRAPIRQNFQVSLSQNAEVGLHGNLRETLICELRDRFDISTQDSRCLSILPGRVHDRSQTGFKVSNVPFGMMLQIVAQICGTYKQHVHTIDRRNRLDVLHSLDRLYLSHDAWCRLGVGGEGETIAMRSNGA